MASPANGGLVNDFRRITVSAATSAPESSSLRNLSTKMDSVKLTASADFHLAPDQSVHDRLDMFELLQNNRASRLDQVL